MALYSSLDVVKTLQTSSYFVINGWCSSSSADGRFLRSAINIESRKLIIYADAFIAIGENDANDFCGYV